MAAAAISFHPVLACLAGRAPCRRAGGALRAPKRQVQLRVNAADGAGEPWVPQGMSNELLQYLAGPGPLTDDGELLQAVREEYIAPRLADGLLQAAAESTPSTADVQAFDAATALFDAVSPMLPDTDGIQPLARGVPLELLWSGGLIFRLATLFVEGDRTSILESHPDLKNCRQVEKEVLKLLRDYLPYSQAQYGLEGSADNKKAQLQSNLTNTCGAKATLVWDEHDAAPNKAAFFVCTLGEDEAVVSICGTHTLQDWITDAQAWGTTFTLYGKEYIAHAGMVKSAQNILQALKLRVKDDATLRAALALPNVTLVGHSLGAGVASLLALLLQQEEGLVTGNCQLKCWAYETPRCVDATLANSGAFHGLVVSIVHEDDCVPRLCKSSLADVLVQALALPTSRVMEAMAVLGKGLVLRLWQFAMERQGSGVMKKTARLALSTEWQGSGAVLKAAGLALGKSYDPRVPGEIVLVAHKASVASAPCTGSDHHTQLLVPCEHDALLKLRTTRRFMKDHSVTQALLTPSPGQPS